MDTIHNPYRQPMQNMASLVIREAQQRRGLSLRELGRRAGTSHATLSAYIKGDKSPSMATLTRIVDACDLALDMTLRPRVRDQNGLPRGEELAQVLRLAEQFPTRNARRPNYPKFPARS